MKKILFVLFILVVDINICFALDIPVFFNISSNCVEVNNNEVVIPIEVVNIKSGDLVTLVDNYKLGLIDNSEEYDISIENIENHDNVDIIYIDGIINNNKQSSIYYRLKNDVHLNIGDSLVKFDLIYSFNSGVPDKLFILGKEIVIADESVCKIVNDFDTNVVKIERIEKDNNYIIYIIVVLLSLVCLGEFVIILRNKRN